MPDNNSVSSITFGADDSANNSSSTSNTQNIFKRFFSELIRPQNSKYDLMYWVFIRALAVVYIIAFLSLLPQVQGLLGVNGILPAASYTAFLSDRFGPYAFVLAPSIFWLTASNAFLIFGCLAGIVAAVVVIAGRYQRLMLGILFILYLSYVNVGQDFLSFQWDILLLEVGFVAILFKDAPNAVRLILWFILFKLMFLSGAVKIASGDPTWSDLTALQYHFETQPLPNFLSWYMHQIPANILKVFTVFMFVIELAVPFLIFLGRRPRYIAGVLFIMLEGLILLTGNYTFFNLFSTFLIFTLYDDRIWRKFVPTKLVQLTTQKENQILPDDYQIIIHQGIVPLAVGFLIAMNILVFANTALATNSPKLVQALNLQIRPLKIVNSYGLFAVMTTERNEIIIEGSNDGEYWEEYVFKYKPQALNKRPKQVAPFQPRLDWQMWFAALGRYEQYPWIRNLSVRLLEGSDDVEGLFKHVPFEEPPKYIRGEYYNYTFTTTQEREETGNWWNTEYLGTYLPSVTFELSE